MNSEALINLLAEALDVDPKVLAADTRIDSVAEWSSIGWLNIMAGLDESMGIQIPVKTIRGFRTVGDVVAYVGEHQAS